jgi:CrcB protein
MTYLSVALGGALGAMLRYGLSGWVQLATGWVLPVGTLAVNILGSFLIGALLQISTDRFLVAPETRLLLVTGFCGGLTTFSTFSYETLVLLEDQQWTAAAGNVLLSVTVCLVATYLGIIAARLV